MSTFSDANADILIESLCTIGYDLVVCHLCDGTLLGIEVPLRNCALRFRDRRVDPKAGDVSVRLTVQPSGTMVGYVEATDAEPGFYDELAQFAIAVAANTWPSLQYKDVRTGTEGAATDLRTELPTTPFGLATL